MVFANQIVARGTFFVNLYNDSHLMRRVVMFIKKQRIFFLHFPFILMTFLVFLSKPFRLFP